MAHLAATLARNGHDVSMIYGEGDATLTRDVIAGVTCIDAVPQWRPRALMEFWKTLHQIAPDVIYARLPNDFLWLIRLYARQSGARFIYAIASDIHCNPWTAYDYKRWFHAPLFSVGLHGAEAIAVQHQQQVPLLPRPLQKRSVHVPNLVRSFKSEPRSFDEARYDAAWVGVIRSEKRIGCFLDLVSALPHLHFALIGGFDIHHEREARAALEERIRSLPNLSFLGPQRTEDVQLLLARSKVLVSTSWVEGFPNAMLEAWSSGVPVASLSVDPGGVIVGEGIGRVSGSMSVLIHDVAELASNRDLNRQLGLRGLSYVRRIHSWEAVYSSLIHALSPSEAANPAVQSI